MNKIKKYNQFVMNEMLETSFVAIPRECANLTRLFGDEMTPQEVMDEYNSFVEEVELVEYEDGNFIDNNGNRIEPLTILIKLNDLER